MITWTRIKHLLLALLIFLSLFLSVGLWTAGGHLGDQSARTGNLTPASLVERTMVEVFAPYQIALHGSDSGESDLQITTTSSVRSSIDAILREMTFEEVVSIEEMSQEDYQNSLSWTTTVEFVYSDDLPFGLLEDKFENLPSDYADQTYNRLAVDLNDPDDFTFYNTETETLYRVEAINVPIERMDDFLDTENLPYVSAEAILFNEGYVYLPAEDIDVDYRNYTVERLPNNLFISRFFTDTSEVDIRPTGHLTRYIDFTQEVRINHASHTLTYFRDRPNLNEMTLTERLNASFDQLQQVENWTETVKFSSYQTNSNQVTFQRYIDGLPVFSYQQYEAEVHISVVESGLRELTVPLRVVQTPLVRGESSKTLPSSEEIVNRIESSGSISLEDIDDVRMGLTWRQIEEDSNVIQFEPNWYVKVESNWFELENFIEMQEELFDGL